MDDAVKAYAAKNSENVLICWEHTELTNIVKKLGVNNPPSTYFILRVNWLGRIEIHTLSLF